MRTIQILISVPDDVEIKVSGSGTSATSGAAKPFVPRDPPPKPAGVCPEHGTEWALVPAGVSKKIVDENGNPKRYNAFWACPERGCNEKPSWDKRDDVVEQLPF